jgi:hypothetical protein
MAYRVRIGAKAPDFFSVFGTRIIGAVYVPERDEIEIELVTENARFGAFLNARVDRTDEATGHTAPKALTLPINWVGTDQE